MMCNIDFRKVADTNDYSNSLMDGREEFNNMLKEAYCELKFYDWCLDIVESYVGIYYAGIVGVFLFRIKPATEEIDEWIWVIVGNLPPIYITSDDNNLNPACALDSYIGAMEDWVAAVEKGDSIDGLVSVNVPATKENAQFLKSRISILDERVLSQYIEDLKK